MNRHISTCTNVMAHDNSSPRVIFCLGNVFREFLQIWHRPTLKDSRMNWLDFCGEGHLPCDIIMVCKNTFMAIIQPHS